MKDRILKYNLIPMMVLFVLSALYFIGSFINRLIIEIKFKSGDYAYKTTDLSGDFLQGLYGEEESIIYLLLAFVGLSLIVVITTLFYQKFLSKAPFMLLSLSAIPVLLYVAGSFCENIFPLAVMLAFDVLYVLLAVIFTLKDFFDFDVDIDEIDYSVPNVHINKRDKLSLVAVIVLFLAGSMYYFRRILNWLDVFDFLSYQDDDALFMSFLIAEIFMIAAVALTVLLLKERVSYATTALLGMGTVLPICFVVSLYGSPSFEGIVICFALYSLYIAASLFVTIRNIKRTEKTG